MDHLKQDEKKHEISEDERKRLEHEVQKLTDDTIKEIDERRRGQGKGNPRQVSAAPAPEGAAGLGRRAAEVPRHVAIIMDGNGRWAKQRGLPRVAGHKRRRRSGSPAMQAAVDHGVEVLTLYAFSSENWRRSAEEIADLTGLMRFYLERELATLDKEGVRLRLIGDYSAFGPDLVARLERAIERTAGNQPADPGGRAQLRLAGGDRRRCARARGQGRRRRDRSRRDRRAGDRRGAPDRRPARRSTC